MTVYSLNFRVFWPLVTILITIIWCLFHALRRDSRAVKEKEEEGGCQDNVSSTNLQLLFKLSLLFLLCYFVIRCCRSSSLQRQHGHHAQTLQPHTRQQNRRSLLETYYEQQIRLSPHVLGHSKAHVSQIVGELIKVGKAKQSDASVTFRGDFVQIGSAYEQHKINTPDCFDILVPLKMPQSLKLETLFAFAGKETTPMLQGSVICGVAAPKKSEWVKNFKQFSDGFCLETSLGHQLSSALVLKWFHWKIQRCLNVIRYQFEERCHITLCVCEENLILKILPRSDYVCCHISMSVRLIPAFHLGDSVFLKAQPWGRTLHQEPRLDAFWGISFSRHEQKLMNWFKDQAPTNSCHLKCLQIMKSLRDISCKALQPNFSSQWTAILNSYNLKTALFYLVLQVPFENWEDSLFLERMEDFVQFLRDSFQKQNMHGIYCRFIVPLDQNQNFFYEA
ncbi:inositol 1,4,5-trisphosphate receptor-interacting protein-like 2 isoform X2 [Bombina bombina]|uniref:inositol 1,4,5-trisphosphate receptor-interacting protein-like 2 isoform X2 n=1 Tax=Bombina bombina TaxID=8345 RepID=UPI00235AB9CE|nr:inositol 1,4,5-trisphosphate receptor-interacting protein-like 2 isoform X2 [Bombina bombina]